MNLQTRPKLFPPLALLAALPAPALRRRDVATPMYPTDDLRRLVATMID